MFQNSEIPPSGKFFLTKVSIVPDFNTFYRQLYMACRFESFWLNFEMMTSQHGARISRFWENSFINQ